MKTCGNSVKVLFSSLRAHSFLNFLKICPFGEKWFYNLWACGIQRASGDVNHCLTANQNSWQPSLGQPLSTFATCKLMTEREKELTACRQRMGCSYGWTASRYLNGCKAKNNIIYYTVVVSCVSEMQGQRKKFLYKEMRREQTGTQREREREISCNL